MKSRIATIFIAVGLLTIVGQTFYRVQQEKKLLEVQMQVQRASLVEGLNSSWRSLLLSKARRGELKPEFVLRWNRKGSELREVFFPVKKSRLDWTVYRKYRETGQLAEALDFLKAALEKSNSWDRVLAIPEWKTIKGEFSETKTAYEETLVNPEAKNAFRTIFEQFSSNKDFTFASNEIEFDRAYYRVTEDGSIEGFVPSIAAIKKNILPEFIRENNLPSADVGNKPWELILPWNLTDKEPFSHFDFLLLTVGTLLLVIGVLVYFSGLQNQRTALLKRVSFMNQVVHELKTPLAGLKLHLQLIQRGSGTEHNMKGLNVSIDRLNRLFDDVVLMNKPFEKVPLRQLSVDELKMILEEFKDEFKSVSVGEINGSEVWVDSQRLRVILRNLIKNAIRYGNSADIRASHDEHFVFIDVQDDGPGVSIPDSLKIFQEFFRSEVAKKKNADGLGLGLFIVKKLAKEMEADVQLLNPGQAKAIFRLILRRVL